MSFNPAFNAAAASSTAPNVGLPQQRGGGESVGVASGHGPQAASHTLRYPTTTELIAASIAGGSGSGSTSSQSTAPVGQHSATPDSPSSFFPFVANAYTSTSDSSAESSPDMISLTQAHHTHQPHQTHPHPDWTLLQTLSNHVGPVPFTSGWNNLASGGDTGLDQVGHAVVNNAATTTAEPLADWARVRPGSIQDTTSLSVPPPSSSALIATKGRIDDNEGSGAGTSIQAKKTRLHERVPYSAQLVHTGVHGPPSYRHHPYPTSLSESSTTAHRRALATNAADSSARDSGTDGDEGSVGANGSRTGPPYRSGRLGVKRRQKYTRSRTGCLGCRARRIKCDEGRPVCRRCQVAKRECTFPDSGCEGDSRKGKSKEFGGQSSSDDDDDDEITKRLAKDVEVSDTIDLGFDVGIGDQLSTFALGSSGIGDTTAALSSSSGSAWDATLIPGQFTAAPFNFVDPVGTTGLDLLGHASGTEAEKQEKWGSQGGGAPMLSTPNFLLPWFPTAHERSLILHYCANAADLMMAIPSGLNPMLAINLPLALDSPRGMNPAADALRITLLGIGAVHQAFLLARSGVSTAQTAAMFQYASNLRDTGKEMVRRAASHDGGGAGSDAALGAGTALATIDIFFGGGGWQENFALAKNMVAYRGGPAEMLKRSNPTQLAEGVSVSPARLMLEILTIYETFGCLTTGQEPTLISDRWESWWFEKSSSTYEEHSVEKQFGMSRVMVHLFSRIARLLSRVAKTKAGYLTEIGGSPVPPSTSPNSLGPDMVVHVDSGTTGLLPASVMPQTLFVAPGSNTPTLDPLSAVISVSTPLTGINALTAEARMLSRDVDAWIESLQITSLEHERVQVGNRAYAYAMKILLLRMAFGMPREEARVQAAAQQVLQHCSISTAAMGMSIDLMWPAVIAGCCVDGASRQWLLTLLEGFKSQCCFDVDTASRIIQEVWRRVDAGEPRADWKPVCDDFGLQVLLC